MSTQRMLAVLVVAVLGMAIAPSVSLATRAIGILPGGPVTKSTVPGAPMVITDSNGVVITCEVTYRETWEPRIVKVQGTVGAIINEGVAVGCVGGNGIVAVDAVILQLGLPSPKRYQSFAGALPNIQSLLLIATPLRILIRYREVIMPINTIGCLYQGPVGFNTGGPLTIARLIIQPNQIVPLSLQLFGPMPCPVNIRVAGTFVVNPIQNLVLQDQ